MPRDLEYNLIKLPVVHTGFGKSSQIPNDTDLLMELEARQYFLEGPKTLGSFIDKLLLSGPRWKDGSPAEQQGNLDAAKRRETTALKAADAKIVWATKKIEEMNSKSSAPENAFGAHTIHTEAGPFVWATLTACWKCDLPMLLWDAVGSHPTKQSGAAPPLRVKPEVGQKRYENHPDVHRVLNQWIRETKVDIGKANIELRPSKAKGTEYSAFVCPSCKAIAGQVFISKLHHNHWSLISAPLLRKSGMPNRLPSQQAKKNSGRRPSPRQESKIRPTEQPSRPSNTATARWARELREKLDRERPQSSEGITPPRQPPRN